MLIRNKLIEFRGNRSQKKMAEMYGVTQQTWSKWELGGAIPSLMVMKQIEIDSKISMEVLFFDVFNKLNLLNSPNPKAS
jgi:transcriptional regulator with XRE-family HTH domain